MSTQVAKSGGSQTPNRRNPLSLSGSTGTKPQKSKSIDEKDSKQDGSTKNEIENNKDLKSSNKKTENQKTSIETSSIKGDNNSKIENGNGVGNKQQQQKQNDTNGQKSGEGEVKPNQINNKLEQQKMKDCVVNINLPKKLNSIQNQEQEKSSQENNKKNHEKDDIKTKQDNKKEDLKTKSDNNSKKENSSSKDIKDISKETTIASKDVSMAKDESVQKNSKELSNGKDESFKTISKEVPNGKEIITKDKVVVEQENGKNEKSEKSEKREKPEKPLESTPVKEISKMETSLENKKNSAKKISTDIIVLDEEDDEMEALVVDISPCKILKMKEVPSPALSSPVVHKKIIPEKKINENERSQFARKLNRSNITEIDSAPPTCTSSPITNDRPYVSSLRSISGRRGLRPLREYSFHNTSYRESYRRITTEFGNTTTSSLNVTIGSEIPNESTFSFFTRGKKREHNQFQPQQLSSQYVQQNDDIETSPKSPKRPRLDFSGFFGLVSTPVSMLRARLSRAKIQSSTPNSKVQQKNLEDEIEEEDCVENVSVFETEDVVDSEEMFDVDIKSSENNIVEDDEDLLKKQKQPDCDLSDKSIEDGIDVVAKEQQQEGQDILMTSTTTNTVNRRRMCNVM